MEWTPGANLLSRRSCVSRCLIAAGGGFYDYCGGQQKYELSADTLRYYERIGLVPPVPRNKSGIRDYDTESCQWVELMKCMRTHAHYYAEAFDPDRDAVLSALPAAGVGLVLCPGCDLDTSRQSIQLAEAYPHVYAAAGVHPEDALGLPVDWLDQVAEMTRHPKVKAIGEIGLDYYWKEVPRDLQKEVFRAQLQLAKVLDLPVIVHDREAHADCLAIVREFPGVRGVFHCYSGSAEDAKTLVKLGWMLSFTGTITFKNARKAPEVIAAVPLERIMVETDAPYMAPTPFRGKRCDSRYVYRMVETIAEIKGLTPAEVEQATTENGKALFAIP